MTQHPITPPIELVQQWFLGAKAMPVDQWVTDVATQAAQWGADQELEACCEYLVRCAQWEPEDVDDLRTTRQPKPQSLKEMALEALTSAPGPDYPSVMTVLNADQHALIRRALEQLDD
jgi:hypothetical protein